MYKVEDGLNKVKAAMKAQGLDALIPIGGEDTLGVAGKLHEDGIPVVGVPKTIDNDLAATDFTFGFQTAVQIATDAIDRLHTTAESHNRVLVVRGHGPPRRLARASTPASPAAPTSILIPERPFDIDEVCEHIQRRHAAGATFSIVVVAEGATPKDGGLLTAAPDDRLVRPRAPRRHRRSCSRRRSRSAPGSSRARRSSATSSAAARRSRSTACSAPASASSAVDAITEGDYGKMVALRGTRIERVPLAEALAEPKLVDAELYETAEVFFG